MGIRITCPNGHKLHVKSYLAGKRGICPKCGASTPIPVEHPSSAVVGTAPAEGTQFDRFDTTSSVIIGVAETPVTSVAINDTAPAVQSVEPAPAIAPVDDPAIRTDSSIDIETAAPVSPVTSYAVRRARNRRNQLTITIALLVAVIVLAVVLIWVLQRGGSQPSPAAIAPDLDFLVDEVAL